MYNIQCKAYVTHVKQALQSSNNIFEGLEQKGPKCFSI